MILTLHECKTTMHGAEDLIEAEAVAFPDALAEIVPDEVLVINTVGVLPVLDVRTEVSMRSDPVIFAVLGATVVIGPVPEIDAPGSVTAATSRLDIAVAK